jgi:hypothetical protein
VSRDPVADRDLEVPSPARCAGRLWPRPPDEGALVEHEVSAQQPGAGLEQPPEQRARDDERWVGDHVERLTGQPQIGGVGLDDGDAGEPTSELCDAIAVALDGDDVGAGAHEWERDRAATGPDVEHDIAAPDASVTNESVGESRIELVPAPSAQRAVDPRWRWRAHGPAPS